MLKQSSGHLQEKQLHQTLGRIKWVKMVCTQYSKKLTCIQGVPGGMDKTSGVFLMLKYTDITQNTYIQSSTVTEIMAREVCESMTAVTHLLITKFIFKLAGICGFCNANICT